MNRFQPVIAWLRGQAAAKSDDRAQRGPGRSFGRSFGCFRRHGRGAHGGHPFVIAVEHHRASSAKHARLGRRVSLHAAVPVQMVLRDVEHCGRRRLEGMCGVQLKAGQLQHPDIGQGIGLQPFGERVQQRGADVAGHGHCFARALCELARERRHGGLAIGARDGDDGGRVAALRLQIGQRLAEQVQLARHGHAAPRCFVQHGLQLGRGQAGAAQHAGHGFIHQAGGQCAARKAHAFRQAGALRRSLARVGHRHPIALAQAPARHRQPRKAQTQNQHVCAHRLTSASALPARPCTAAW